MTEYISSLQPTELQKVFARHYNLAEAGTIDELYRSALALHSNQPIGFSTKQDLIAHFAHYKATRGESRFSLPFTFTLDDTESVSWIKQTSKFAWHTLETFVNKPNIKTAMLVAPVAYQIGPLFFQECYKRNVVATHFDTTNVASAGLVLSNHPIEALVTTSVGLQALIAIQAKLPKDIMLIEAWGVTPILLNPDNVKIVYDIHLTPGVPIAFQNNHSIGENFTVTPNTDYLFTQSGEGLYITALTERALPLFHYRLSTAVARTSASSQASMIYV